MRSNTPPRRAFAVTPHNAVQQSNLSLSARQKLDLLDLATDGLIFDGAIGAGHDDVTLRAHPRF